MGNLEEFEQEHGEEASRLMFLIVTAISVFLYSFGEVLGVVFSVAKNTSETMKNTAETNETLGKM